MLIESEKLVENSMYQWLVIRNNEPIMDTKKPGISMMKEPGFIQSAYAVRFNTPACNFPDLKNHLAQFHSCAQQFSILPPTPNVGKKEKNG